MRKNLLLALCLAAGLTASAQTVANMDSLTVQQKADATNVQLTGRLTTQGNSDFRQLRDLCWQLLSADLSKADCPAIPKNALHSRHHLQSVVLPQNVKTIGAQAFFACDKLVSLTLPASTDTVKTAAFDGCTSLERLVIEGSPVLEQFAFAGCKSLKTVEVKSAVPPVIAPTAFEGIDRKTCQLVVPKGSEKAYRKAAGWSRFFTDPEATTDRCNPEACLIPTPAQITVDSTAAPLTVRLPWRITASAGLENEMAQAYDIIHRRTGQSAAAKASKKVNRLELGLDETLTDPEAYTLAVTSEGITIKGKTAEGVFRGLTTMEQLLMGNAEGTCCATIPQLAISDAPRTHIREFMVDPARIFVPFERLKAIVPEIARYKFNALHLHLVDDQAWRIEMKHYPELTQKSSARVGMDDMQMPIEGYYTQEQMRELVEYAATFHVQVIPEIEMPGHEVAAIHAFPQLTCGAKEVPIRTTCGVSNELLCPGEDFVYEFLGNVFAELADIFPSPYIHLGGDEAGQPALDCWTTCEKCRALKQRLGITTTDRSENWRLQKYLFDAIIDTLRTKYNKTPMFWYETDFKEIQAGCVTYAWRHRLTNAAIEAAINNNARIMLCPGEHCYLDYPMEKGDMPEINWGMPNIPLERSYALDPAWGHDEAFEANNLFGVACVHWSECINSPERIFYQAFPRGLAIAEAGWSRASRRSYDDFLRRLAPNVRDMLRRGVACSLQY